jgi:(2Fe-2S) ferredoxin
MSKKDKHVSLFSLEGRFLGFEREDGYKLKRLRLATAEGELCIKLSRESRASVGGVLMPGDWIQIWGEKTVKKDETRFKAHRIVVLFSGQGETASPQPSVQATSQPSATILMCQKSDCMKRGGKALCKVLEKELGDRQLSDQVTVRPTGCMKACKGGPNLVFPGKTRYTHVAPEDIPTLLERHFSTPANHQLQVARVLPTTPH